MAKPKKTPKWYSNKRWVIDQSEPVPQGKRYSSDQCRDCRSIFFGSSQDEADQRLAGHKCRK